MSWPGDIRDSPAYLNFGAVNGRVLYGEDVYVGYRYYDMVERKPLFGFGYVPVPPFSPSHFPLSPSPPTFLQI
jgi:hypothetical protein